MLDLDELFKKRPFIYCIDGTYYAFGTGVCSRCDNDGNYVTLPKRYQNYSEALKANNISQKEAWDVYKKLVSVADAVKTNEEHIHLMDQFDKLNFSATDKTEIENQLKNLVKFFKQHELGEFYK